MVIQATAIDNFLTESEINANKYKQLEIVQGSRDGSAKNIRNKGRLVEIVVKSCPD